MEFNNTTFFDSLSPFWIIINDKGIVESTSKYFSNDVAANDKLDNHFQMRKTHKRSAENFIDSLSGKILKLTSEHGLSFRANIHPLNEKGLLVMWPLLSDLSEIRRFNLQEEMAHPSSLMTDVIVGKDMIKKNFEKLKNIEKKNSEILLSNMLEGMIVQDSKGFVVDFNPAALNIIGIKGETLKGKGPDTPDWYYLKEDGSLLKKEEYPPVKCVKTGKPVRDVIMGLEQKDKSIKWLNVSSSPLYKDDEVFAVSTFQDITEKRKKSSEFKAYADGLNKHAMVTRTDTKGVLHDANDRFVNLTGYLKSELIGRTHNVVNSDYHSKEFFSEMWDIILSGKIWRGEVRNKTKDGKYYWVDTTITPILDYKQDPVEFITISYDITDKKIAEFEVKERERRLRQLFDQSRDPQMTLEPPNWVFSSGNQATLDFFKVESHDEFKKLGPWSVSPEFQPDGIPSADKAKTAITKAMEEGINFFEWTHSNMDGKQIPCTVLLSRIQEGDKTYLHAIVRDISKQKELENQKRMSFHNAKLASLGQLAAGVGHEINNPMAIVKGHTSILKKSIAKDKLKMDMLNDSLEKIDSAVDRVTKIVQGLKTFSRNDHGEFCVFDFSQMVISSIDLIKDIYAQEDIKFVSSIKEGINFNGDIGRLQQVLVNLFSNAKDAMAGRSNKEITVNLSSDNKKLNLSVSDTGAGIPIDIADNIFDPFFTSKGVNEGTGIGLALSHQIITEHGGRIYLEESTEGKTTFSLELKLSDEKPASKKEQKDMPAVFDDKSLGSILIAEDENEIRDILQMILEDIGYTVTAASDGVEAWNIYQEHNGKFDLVITDMQMPKMNGADLIQHIKSFKNSGTHCLVITGGVNINFEDDKSCIGKLIDDYIPKPFDEKTILDKLSKFNKNPLEIS